MNRLERNVTYVKRSLYKLPLEYFILILILEIFIRGGGGGVGAGITFPPFKLFIKQ